VNSTTIGIFSAVFIALSGCGASGTHSTTVSLSQFREEVLNVRGAGAAVTHHCQLGGSRYWHCSVTRHGETIDLIIKAPPSHVFHALVSCPPRGRCISG